MSLSRRLCLLIALSSVAFAAPADRILRPIDGGRTRTIPGARHRQADPQFDGGAVEQTMPIADMMLVFKLSSSQQEELTTLLADQQNPSSPRFHQWLTPEEFGSRFGLSAGDHSKVVAWLASQGFTVNQSARGRNWVTFSGTAQQVSRALRTPIHRFDVNGARHFSNTAEPSLPEALADVTDGILGLDDFYPESMAHMVEPQPQLTSGTAHFLTPEDYATIYNIAPLYKAGFDGTGQNIAIVGQSAVLLSDLRAFRTRYGLPPNDPKMVLYSTTDPGITSSQVEGNLDLEWAGAIAPNATIYYVYGPSAFSAMIAAINLNVAPIISVSYGTCEVNASVDAYRSISQQANAQGITILAASGDSGAAGCDRQGVYKFATGGRIVDFPAVVPEITAVGGTQFVEGTGTYWSATNSPNFGSALSYIPEAAWNESGVTGLLSSGGGASLLYPRPAWQTGPGVPNDGVRHVPDISLSAAGHDAYQITVQGTNGGVSGTSCSAPSMAGILAVLNQYQVSKGFQKQPGLGNINPQLYRLAQSAPSAFHDTISGNNIVQCSQGSPDCSSGSFGYPATQGYDMATGLGSIDANNFVTLWNTKTQDVTVVLSLSAARVSPDETLAMTAGVYPVSGAGTPTGTVTFSTGLTLLGSAPVAARAGQQVADLYIPAYKLQGTGTFPITAQYSGDAAFSSGGTIRTVQVAVPTGAAATGAASIIAAWPLAVFPNAPDGQGISWASSFTLREAAGVPARITSFTVDGVAQNLSQFFPSLEIAPLTSYTYPLSYRNLQTPVTKKYVVTGTDLTGQTWSREFSINFNPTAGRQNFNLSATPLVVTQNTANPACPWAVQINVDETGGYANSLNGLFIGNVSSTAKIVSLFGTERLDVFGSAQGTLCFSDITPPASNLVFVGMNSGVSQEVAVSFTGPPANPTKLTATPAIVKLSAASAAKPATATLSIGITDKTQQWTAAIYPANRLSAWLSLSQYSGTGPGQITLSADGTGFTPGAYRATIVLQSQNAVPQWINVPVMFVLGNSTSSTSIAAVINSASGGPGGSPGALMTIYGNDLAPGTVRPGTSFSFGGVSVAVNGTAAELVYISPTQINIEIPYEIGTGPAIVAVNNNGQIASAMLDIAPTSPEIFTDTNGVLVTQSSAARGATATVLLSGAGEVAPVIPDGFVPAPTSVGTFRPALPLTVTVGGVQAFVKLNGLVPAQHSVMQVDFVVPSNAPLGSQPVVVTVNGVRSPAGKLTVQPAP